MHQQISGVTGPKLTTKLVAVVFSMKFGTMTQFDPSDRSDCYNLKFRKSKIAAAAILKNRKLTYLRHGYNDFDKIWHSDAVRPSWPLRLLKNYILEIQDGGSRHVEKYIVYFANKCSKQDRKVKNTKVVTHTQRQHTSKLHIAKCIKNKKIKNRDISATLWPIATKFGMVTRFDTHDASHN